MQHNLLSQTRQNRLIATVRIFQGCFALASVLVEQKGSAAGFGLQVRELLTGYLGVSLLSFLVASFWRGRHEVLFLCLLAIDGLVFAALIYLTAGATSACLSLFLLVVLSAALQWGWRGAALATAMVLVAFTATGLPIYHQLTGFRSDVSAVSGAPNRLSMPLVMRSWCRPKATTSPPTLSRAPARRMRRGGSNRKPVS